MNRNCMHIKRTLTGRVILHVFCSPEACLSPGPEVVYVRYCVISCLHYPDHRHAEIARFVPGATETEGRQSNNKTPCL